jgi:hypothetical protein
MGPASHLSTVKATLTPVVATPSCKRHRSGHMQQTRQPVAGVRALQSPQTSSRWEASNIWQQISSQCQELGHCCCLLQEDGACVTLEHCKGYTHTSGCNTILQASNERLGE